MRYLKNSTFFLSIMATLMSAPLFGQYKTNQEAVDYINDRLSHSIVQKIDDQGLVTMKAPSEQITFLLSDVVFSYNDLNGDSRVRIACNNCLKYYEKREFDRKESRQSFLCDEEDDAFEVIKAFEFLKGRNSSGSQLSSAVDRKIPQIDTSLRYSTVKEAVALVNRLLVHSMITTIDDRGIMIINAPSDNYRIDLRNAEFGFNDLSDDPKVRIYGDFCIDEIDNDGSSKPLSRQSFTSHSRLKAYRAIKALYYIKTAYSDLSATKVPMLRNVRRIRATSYNSVQEAIDFINDRLVYSVVMNIDDKGMMNINAPDEIYRVNLKKSSFVYAKNSKVNIDWLGITFDSGRIDGVQIECNNCLEKYNSPRNKDIVDEQTFQCENETLVKEVIKAFVYLKEKVK